MISTDVVVAEVTVGRIGGSEIGSVGGCSTMTEPGSVPEGETVVVVGKPPVPVVVTVGSKPAL
jgi:hypothetical protein